MSLGLLFDEQHKESEILFQEGGAVNINELPLSKHHDRGKDQVMMASHSETEVVGDVAVQLQSELDLGKMVQNLFKNKFLQPEGPQSNST